MREYLEEIRENWTDAYWRADHPEVMAVLIGILTGLLGLAFAWLELTMRNRLRLPETKDV